MRKFFLKIILLQFTLLYSDTTIVAFDAVHQYFGSLGNNRTVIDTIEFPDSNTGYSDITMHLNLECPTCLLYTSPSPRDKRQSRMPSSA